MSTLENFFSTLNSVSEPWCLQRGPRRLGQIVGTSVVHYRSEKHQAGWTSRRWYGQMVGRPGCGTNVPTSRYRVQSWCRGSWLHGEVSCPSAGENGDWNFLLPDTLSRIYRTLASSFYVQGIDDTVARPRFNRPFIIYRVFFLSVHNWEPIINLGEILFTLLACFN